MRRSPRVLAAWLAAFAVAAFTARTVSADLGSLHRRARSLGADVRVIVAVHDLPLGSVVATSDVRTITLPSRAVAPDVVHTNDAAIGRTVRADLLAGDAVRERALVVRGETAPDALVPDGSRAMHVVSKDGFQPPLGSVVDVLAAFDPTAASVDDTRDGATTVATGARVIGLDAPARDSPGGSGVLVLVREREANAVAFAAANGSLTLALAPPSAACCANDTR